MFCSWQHPRVNYLVRGVQDVRTDFLRAEMCHFEVIFAFLLLSDLLEGRRKTHEQ